MVEYMMAEWVSSFLDINRLSVKMHGNKNIFYFFTKLRHFVPFISCIITYLP